MKLKTKWFYNSLHIFPFLNMLFFKIELKNSNDLIFIKCKLVSHTISFTGLIHDFPCEFSTIEPGTYIHNNKKKHWQKIGFSNNYPSKFDFAISWILKICSKIILLINILSTCSLTLKAWTFRWISANPAANIDKVAGRCTSAMHSRD